MSHEVARYRPRQSASTLSGLPALLNCLSERELAVLSDSYRGFGYKKGTVLYHANAANVPVLFIRTGLVCSQTYEETGESLIAQLFGPNSLVFPGYSTGGRGGFDFVGLSPGFALSWPAATLKQVLTSNAVFATRVLDLMLSRRHEDAANIARARSCSLEKRLALFYWSLAEVREGSVRHFPNTIPQKAIAAFLGTSREEVSRKTSLLEKAGYLKLEANGMSLDDEICQLFFMSAHEPAMRSRFA